MMFITIKNTIAQLEKDTSSITDERKKMLSPIINYIKDKKSANLPIQLHFICTHNSRRSHLAQIWASVAAHHYAVPSVATFSGGTEATAFNPNAIEALESLGFQIEKPEGENPKYLVHFSESASPVTSFSKVFDDNINPSSNFAAIMTCSDADENCPFIPGTDQRIPLTYEDPKIADGTPHEKMTYQKRTLQIGRELLYVFSQV
ncbi:MAG: protein-tyrosine-phosphatase [Saprospiraceae bacterium]|jgi:arsenate reductase|nr:protein-tyrosine-phosphatase [Saprospiraceae bacterium]